jgi:hypothetical protein
MQRLVSVDITPVDIYLHTSLEGASRTPGDETERE